MGVNVNLNLKIMVRIQVLYEVVKQFSSDLGFPEAQEKILKKGIEERQILREVILYYMKDNGKAGSWVSFEIDWEKHQMLVNTEGRKEITINKNMTLLDQFAQWSECIVKYIDDMKRALEITDIQVIYRYRKEINQDPEKQKEADEFLGLKTTTEEIEMDSSVGNQLREMSFESEFLSELKISIG